jgi:hypothetical protein
VKLTTEQHRVESGLRDRSNTSDHLRDACHTWVTSHVYRKTVATSWTKPDSQHARSPTNSMLEEEDSYVHVCPAGRIKALLRLDTGTLQTDQAILDHVTISTTTWMHRYAVPACGQ